MLCLRRKGAGSSGSENVKGVSAHGILSGDEFRAFWISWKNGLMEFGTGSTVGSSVVLQYNDTAPIQCNYLAVAGYGTNGIYHFYEY